jgi:hypothetical protein
MSSVHTDTDRIKEAARGRWPEILSALGGLPREILDGKHHPCPKCNGKDRFRYIDDQAGAVLCNQCFTNGNGDGISALEWLRGWDFGTAISELRQYLGTSPNGSGKQHPNGKTPNTYATSSEALAAYKHYLGEPSTWWEYLDAAGLCVGLVYRWDTASGKEIRPVSRIGDGWQCAGMPEPRPLYRLPDVMRAGGFVCVVEGEKAAESIRGVGLVATTSASGAKSPRKTDWSALAAKQVVILPDNDEPGQQYATTVIEILTKLAPAPTIKVLRLPGLPEKGDAADYIQARRADGATVDAIRDEIVLMAQQATPPEAPKAEEPPEFTHLIDSAALLALDIRQRYLVRGMLVQGQPAVIGGRSKTLKTSVAIDLAISLGSGTLYLGHWQTERCRVAVWSGESGAATIRETARRIAAARGIDLTTCDVLWAFSLPKLSHVTHLDHLRQTIIDQGIAVSVIDPLYLALLNTETAGQASNVYAMGAALQPVGEIGQQTGCTMVVLHHFRKSGQADPDEPAALEELAQSGVVEWARQWILLARRSPYASDGRHQLWLRVGGSAGHAGLYALDIAEGIYDPETADGGRRWDVAVHSVADVRTETRRAADDRRAQQISERQSDDRRRMLEALRRCPDGETMRRLRELAGLSGTRAADAVRALVGEGRAEAVEILRYRRRETGYRAIDR